MPCYDKLVRDNIPDIIKNSGKQCIYHIAKDDKEFKKALDNKLSEEILEYLNNPNIEELSDILLVVNNLISYYGEDALKAVYDSKLATNGDFKNKIILEKVEG